MQTLWGHHCHPCFPYLNILKMPSLDVYDQMCLLQLKITQSKVVLLCYNSGHIQTLICSGGQGQVIKFEKNM